MLNKLAKLLKRGGASNTADFTPQQEIEAAQRAIKAGELMHAAYHVGCALTSDPNRAEWLQLLDKIADISDKPLDLAPTGERNYIGTVAVRAYLLARLRQWSEALDLLLQVASETPDIGYLEWAITWLNVPEAAGNIDVTLIVGYFGRTLDHIPQLEADDRANRETLERIPRLIESAYRTQNVDTQSIFAFVIMLRRLRRLVLMKVIAEESFAKRPDYHTANAVALVFRERGDRERAIQMLREALKYQPDDLPARLDIGDILLEDGRYVDAGAVYAEVLHLQPEHPWATPSFYAAQALARGDEVSRHRFDAYADEHPDNTHAQDLKALFAPYFGDLLPRPREAMIDGVEKLLASGYKGSGVLGKMELTSLEAPSAAFAINLEVRRRVAPDAKIELEVPDVGSPDPRAPRVPVPFQLWRYEGITALPGVPEPSPKVAKAVRDLLSTQYSATGWFQKGKEIGAALGPESVDDLLGAMVHPMPAFAEYRSWDWLKRAQYAACFILAGIDTGWDDSRRREVLTAIVNGPADWTVGAASVVLAMIVRECPVAELDVTTLLWDTAVHSLRLKGYVAQLEPVLLSLLRMPNLPDVRRQQVQERLQEMWAS
jgi:tetratricopeptide (TPR) repeat protein